MVGPDLQRTVLKKLLKIAHEEIVLKDSSGQHHSIKPQITAKRYCSDVESLGHTPLE